LNIMKMYMAISRGREDFFVSVLELQIL